MKLVLVRHGESTWNAEGRYQGRMDPPLSERGEIQARTLAAELAGSKEVRPVAVVSSPLERARRTAEFVVERLEVGAPVIDERLIEISHGKWEGLLKSEIERRWPAMMAAWRNEPDTVRFSGGESLADVRTRWRSFLEDVRCFESPLLILTHDVIVRLAVLDARGEPLSAFHSLVAENAAFTEFEWSSGQLRLIRLNVQSHLGAYRADPGGQAL